MNASKYDGNYSGHNLDRVAFPLGGIGAGMVCIEGTGALSHVSLRGKPLVFNEPMVFSALCVKGDENVARLLEGPVPQWKAFGPEGTGNGAHGKTYGLPRFSNAAFSARFPFATVGLSDPKMKVEVEVTAWSPFVPADADRSSLPAAALEYRFTNNTDETLEAVYSFHARNFMTTKTEGKGVSATQNGFVLSQKGDEEQPWDEGAFSATVDDDTAKTNCAWFRGGWFDPLTLVWKAIKDGDVPEAAPLKDGDPSPGGSIYVPFSLKPGEDKTVRLRLAWYVPGTNIRHGKDPEEESACEGGCCDKSPAETHKPWYVSAFDGIDAVTAHWREQYDELREKSEAFSDCFYDSTLPPEAIDAVAANLTILKSPTVQRQADGRLWCWEGCCDTRGCCHGSCTHVWNYAQALPHLFPSLERSLRETEFGVCQDDRGHQAFRASLPIRPTDHGGHAASDGQLGGIMKIYREWRISGDTEWLTMLWPKVKQSLDYCIETWDPDHKGALIEPHHNTYDIEFWGPDGMCTSFYLGALKAAIAMADALDDSVPLYGELLKKGRAFMESELWDGDYFIQKIMWRELRAGKNGPDDKAFEKYSVEAKRLLEQEGPKYQYGTGCLSDGVLGAWIAAVCGVDDFLNRDKVESHLVAVHAHNLKRDLSEHANPQRPSFAFGAEGGLLLCSWPKGGALSLPFVYSDEVWTGIEYQVASHLMLMGRVEEGLEIVRVARDRYDGTVRNPFNEYECGHWYARAMASYGLIQGMTGIRYDAVEKKLYVHPRIEGDFRSFLCTATGYGTVGVKDGKAFVEVRQGEIAYESIDYRAA